MRDEYTGKKIVSPLDVNNTMSVNESIERSKKLCDDLFSEFSTYYRGSQTTLVRSTLELSLTMLNALYERNSVTSSGS